MSDGRPDVRRLLEAHGLRPRRSLGQNFVTDPNTLARVVRLAELEHGDPVVEVGAGLGSLTVALADAGAAVLALEVDPALVPVLESVLGERAVTVLEADATKVDWSEITKPRDRPWTLVANLPYNVATTIVLRALEEAPTIRRMVVMVQREVGERLAAAPGDPHYGAVSVKVAYWSTAKIVARVPPTVFHPRPKVESVIVRIDRRAEAAVATSDVPYDRLFRVVKAGFAHRRKMLRRSLAGVVGSEMFAVAEIAESARAEELSVEDWGRLAAEDGVEDREGGAQVTEVDDG